MEFILKKCHISDLENLRELAYQTFDDTFGHLNTPENMQVYLEKAFSREKLQDELTNPLSRFFFLAQGSQLVGYLKINEGEAQTDLKDSASLEIERIYIKKEFQGYGLGKKLIEQAVEIAVKEGKQYLWLGVWEKNQKAIAFYKKMGFREVGTHHFYMGDEKQRDFIMRRDLMEGGYFMDFNKEVWDLALEQKISYYGVADLSLAPVSVVDQVDTGISEYPFAISLGIALPKAIVDQLPRRAEHWAALNYHHHAYDIINHRLDLAASTISSFIQSKGYRVLPIPAAERVDDEKICGQFSHKLAAYLSGLGWIGKSCLLVTPDNGPRVRWTSILTDAPLKPTGNKMAPKCGKCRKCVEICPMQAFTGKNFADNEPREVRYDAGKCQKYFEQMESEGKLAVCGMCLYACPHG